MDQMVQCSWLWAMVHLFVAIAAGASAVLVARINNRNKRVDQEREEEMCDVCRNHLRHYHREHGHRHRALDDTEP